uniref:thiol oxidase n=1 Tax=viral metagenome TaxID=1070528 RepID=A0A6C0AD87_9ZZZZ
MDVSPDVWGDYYWFVFYTTALTYKEDPTNQEKDITKTFLMTLGKKLPCNSCSDNFDQHLEKFPLDNEVLKNNNNLLEWVVNIHNEVNKITRSKLVTSDEMKKKYIKIYNQKKINKQCSNYIYIIVFLLVLLSIILYFKLNY